MRSEWACCVSLLLLACLVDSKCYHVPEFPVPTWKTGQSDLAATFALLDDKLSVIASRPEYDNSSFSIELTSTTQTLWSWHHTARHQNASRPGVKVVDGDSVYRIASISKTFTVLGLLYQHQAGNLSLDDPVDKYLPELRGEIPWKDITLRSLASQLSGIRREFNEGDLYDLLPDPTVFGLPPSTRGDLPDCGAYYNGRPCNSSDMYGQLAKQQPLFAPNQKSSYSNANFAILGQVLENVTGISYEAYMAAAVFEPLNMTSSSLRKPSDERAVLPLATEEQIQYGIGIAWDTEEGVNAPTGGIYSTSSDLSKYLRYVLTHFNTLATGVNWFLPISMQGLRSFYGLSWTVFVTEKILTASNRPVTFVAKDGGLAGYYSRIISMPEYGLGLTILIGGSYELLDELTELLTVDLVRAAEELIWKAVASSYDGVYLPTDSQLNSSVVLSSSPSTGIVVESFISNGTDIMEHREIFNWGKGDGYYTNLMPTLLFKNETSQQGEIYRALVATETPTEEKVWDDNCSSAVDLIGYVGKPVNEFVFWHEEHILELPAWNLKLRLADNDEMHRAALVVQS